MPSNSNRSIGKGKISYYYSSKQGSVNNLSPLAAHGPSNPGQVCASHSCLRTEQHSSARLILSTVSDYIDPGIFLACAEINKHRLNRALGIREKENAEEVCQWCQTNRHWGAWTLSWGRAEGEQNPTVTPGQDCYRVLHNLHTASYVNCVLL